MEDDDLEIPEFLKRSKTEKIDLEDSEKHPPEKWGGEIKKDYVSINERIESDEIPREPTKDQKLIDHFAYILAVKPKEFSAYRAIKMFEISTAGARKVLEYFQPLLDEFIEFGTTEKDKYYGQQVKLLRIIVDDLDTFLNNKKITRKKRKQKPSHLKAAKAAERLHYKKEDLELKIASIDPATIIGAQELWTYNTKYRTVSRYIAASPDGLKLKGTSIDGFDEKTSQLKRLKHPLKQLPPILEAGRVVIRTAMNDIPSDPKPVLARITPQVVLLRVIRGV